MPSEAVAPISTPRGGFALFRGRHARHKRRIVMAAKLEPEQFERVRADLLLRLSKCGTVDHNQLGDVLRRHAFERVTHQEVRQRLRYPEANMDGCERMPEGVASHRQAGARGHLATAGEDQVRVDYLMVRLLTLDHADLTALHSLHTLHCYGLGWRVDGQTDGVFNLPGHRKRDVLTGLRVRYRERARLAVDILSADASRLPGPTAGQQTEQKISAMNRRRDVIPCRAPLLDVFRRERDLSGLFLVPTHRRGRDPVTGQAPLPSVPSVATALRRVPPPL